MHDGALSKETTAWGWPEPPLSYCLIWDIKTLSLIRLSGCERTLNF